MLLAHFRADMAALGPAGSRGLTGLEARSLGITIVYLTYRERKVKWFSVGALIAIY